MESPVIEVKNLSKLYKSYRKPAGVIGSIRSLFWREAITVEAVREISFNVKRGELVGFLGPNGAGKTTTLKMLSGILHPSSGEAKVLGYVPWERRQEFQKRFALVMGQKTQLWWDLPPMDSFLLNKEIYEIPERTFKQSLKELTELLDIADLLNVPVRKLSLGERMKAELVGSLLHKPEVLFLDEPTIGLDVSSQLAIREFLRRYNRQFKTTILLTSHYMEDVEALCERVIIINKGEKVYDGGLDDLVKRTVAHKVISVTFTAPVGKEELTKYGQVKEFEPQRALINVPREMTKQAAASILSDLPVDDLLIDEPDVEDVISKFFKETAK